jgi:hypothetical protein
LDQIHAMTWRDTRLLRQTSTYMGGVTSQPGAFCPVTYKSPKKTPKTYLGKFPGCRFLNRKGWFGVSVRGRKRRRASLNGACLGDRSSPDLFLCQPRATEFPRVRSSGCRRELSGFLLALGFFRKSHDFTARFFELPMHLAYNPQNRDSSRTEEPRASPFSEPELPRTRAGNDACFS